MDMLERIDENKTPSQRAKSSTKAPTVGAVNSQRIVSDQNMKASHSKSNINDIS
jgi:hypothetical protein